MRRNIPALNAVAVLQQRSIQRLDRCRVGKVETRYTVCIYTDKIAQRRVGADQAREVVMPLMAIAWMQGGGMRIGLQWQAVPGASCRKTGEIERIWYASDVP